MSKRNSSGSFAGKTGKEMATLFFIGAGFVLVMIAVYAVTTNNTFSSFFSEAARGYRPRINPLKFSTKIDNKYFSLPVGKKIVYEGQTAEGLERVVIEIPGDTKEIMGVTTLVYWDRVWVGGELVEETWDYLAQDDKGNVWYFGENVDNYENGVVVNHDGSWIAGEDGAQPGIWMLGKPKVGQEYRQEYYEGEAEDWGKIVATNATVVIGMGTYQGCVQTYDFTHLDPNSKEHKYYCPEVGAMVLSEHLITEESVEAVELSQLEVSPTPDDDDDDDDDDNRRKDSDRNSKRRTSPTPEDEDND